MYAKWMTRRVPGERQARRPEMLGRTRRGSARLGALLVVLGISEPVFHRSPPAPPRHELSCRRCAVAWRRACAGKRAGDLRTWKEGRKPPRPDLLQTPAAPCRLHRRARKGRPDQQYHLRDHPVVDECQTVRNFGLADSFNEFVHAMRSYHRQCKSGSYMGGADGNGAVHRNPVHCHRFERELDGVRFRRAGYGNSVLPRNHRRREVPTRKSRVSAGGLAVVSAPVRVLCAGRRRTRFRQPQFRPGSVGPPCSAQDCESVQAAYLPQPCSPADPRRARIHADGNTVRPPFKDCTAVISPGSPAAGDGYPTGGDVGR